MPLAINRSGKKKKERLYWGKAVLLFTRSLSARPQRNRPRMWLFAFSCTDDMYSWHSLRGFKDPRIEAVNLNATWNG